MSERACYTCGGTGHFARECPSKTDNGAPVRRTGGGERSCYRCQKPGHLARDCTQEGGNNNSAPQRTRSPQQNSGNCFKCGDAGHWSRECTNQDQQQGGQQRAERQSNSSPMRSGRSGGERRPQTCFNCGQQGHIAAGCSQEANRNCFRCSEAGHFARDCPNNQQSQQQPQGQQEVAAV